MKRGTGRVWALLAFTLLACGSLACGDDGDSATLDGADGAASAAVSGAAASGAAASASTTANASAAPTSKPKTKADTGPTVTIPAGKLRAGSRCYDIPRIRPNELEHDEMSLGSFEMDLYPYPNEAGKAAKLDVTYPEATEMCAARGKRLCSELEWERACKGPKNSTYMWGDPYKKDQCRGQLDHKSNQRPECKTGFGVMDMMGVSLEWTSSSWERGTSTGHRVVRGARAEKVSWLSARCTHSRKRDPNKTYDNVGFRCCSGEESSAKVSLRQKKHATIVEEHAIDEDFQKALLRGMPKDHRKVDGVKLSFDKLYRWRPVANEEMILARWRGQPKEGGAFYEIGVFKVCGKTAWRTATMKGPVGKIGKPQVGMNARRISFDVKTNDDEGTLKIKYWHGTVRMNEPGWIVKGNTLKVKKRGGLFGKGKLKTKR